MAWVALGCGGTAEVEVEQPATPEEQQAVQQMQQMQQQMMEQQKQLMQRMSGAGAQNPQPQQ